MEPPINPANGAPIATVRHHRDASRLIIEVDGEIDRATSQYLAGYIDGHLEEADGALALALGGVRFCDSSGVRMILNLARAASEAGRAFSLVQPSPEVRRTIEVCGAAEVLPIDS